MVAHQSIQTGTLHVLRLGMRPLCKRVPWHSGVHFGGAYFDNCDKETMLVEGYPQVSQEFPWRNYEPDVSLYWLCHYSNDMGDTLFMLRQAVLRIPIGVSTYSVHRTEHFLLLCLCNIIRVCNAMCVM